MSRTDFEAAYIERYGHRPRGWNDDFQVYQDAHANGAWFGWQARAAGIEAKAAPVGEREAFEAHMRVGGYSNPDKHPDGSYVSSAMELWWQGWKARAAHQRQQAREVVMPERKDESQYRGTGLIAARQWNACLDEFARLNKGAGSHE